MRPPTRFYSGRHKTRTCATILRKTGHHPRARRRIRRTLCRISCGRCRSSAAHHPLAAVGGQCTGSTPSAGHPVTYQRPLEGPLWAIDLEVLHTPIGVCRRQEFAHTPRGAISTLGCPQNSAHKKRGHPKHGVTHGWQQGDLLNSPLRSNSAPAASGKR